MKKLLTIAAIIAAFFVGKYSTHKDYEVACVMSDICRQTMDHLGTDAEDIYYDYVDNLDCLGVSFDRKDLEDYGWCY